MVREHNGGNELAIRALDVPDIPWSNNLAIWALALHQVFGRNGPHGQCVTSNVVVVCKQGQDLAMEAVAPGLQMKAAHATSKPVILLKVAIGLQLMRQIALQIMANTWVNAPPVCLLGSCARLILFYLTATPTSTSTTAIFTTFSGTSATLLQNAFPLGKPLELPSARTSQTTYQIAEQQKTTRLVTCAKQIEDYRMAIETTKSTTVARSTMSFITLVNQEAK